MPRPTTTAEVRALLANRALTRPTNSEPTVGVDGATATIRLYDPIDGWGGWWGMSAAEFADAIDKLPAEITEIRLLINCPGGDVFDGVAITNILGAHPARIVAVVQGLAASAASFIGVRADELVMNPGSMLMVHDASAVAYGWAEDLRQMADLLDKVSDNIAGMYAAKAGGTAAEWRATMLAETWYTAEEAVAAGLADRVGAASEDDAPAAVEPEPEPFSPFEDRAVPAFTAELVHTPAEARQLLDELSKIDPQPGDDVDATGTGDPIRHRHNAMRLALATA
jgi:ATP-dependent protease ClpP protease subunit